jgi:hypothetical protein
VLERRQEQNTTAIILSEKPTAVAFSYTIPMHLT